MFARMIDRRGDDSHPVRKLSPNDRVRGPANSAGFEIMRNKDRESLVRQQLRKLQMAFAAHSAGAVKSNHDGKSSGLLRRELIDGYRCVIEVEARAHADSMRESLKSGRKLNQGRIRKRRESRVKIRAQ